MADKYKTPTMDWSTPGDIHKRFELFRQKCELIFNGPLEDREEAYKVRMLLLWIDDKGLEIYNAARWDAVADRLRLQPVWQKLEAYVRPRSNQILARFQLRCLKQGDLSLEEFLTRARTLIDDSGYGDNVKEEVLRDTLVFGVKSDKARREAIAIGNDLTFQQVYELAKTEESTKAQMDIIAKGASADVHALKSRSFDKANSKQTAQRRTRKPNAKRAAPPADKTETCGNCGSRHSRSDTCPAKGTKCHFCKRKGHYERMCRTKKRQVHDIEQSDDDNDSQDSLDYYTLQSIETIKTICDVTTRTGGHIDKVYAKVKLNDSYSTRLKVDTGSDTCTITTEELQKSGLPVTINPSNCILKNYGGGIIKNYGTTNMKITYRDRSTRADFRVVNAPNSPSILGCQQALELGMITLDVNSVNSTKMSAHALSRDSVLNEYKDCFDKIGRFPGAKYEIKLIDDAKPVVHAPRTVPVHIMPLYKAELDKMLADGIITPVTEPTDWVNSIVCNITETKKGKKVRLCLDPKDLNKNIKREHYYSRTIDEILPMLHNKKFFSVIDTKKGYWHVELDEKSSLLTTFNTPFGRFKFNRLPFGLWMSQDIFQPKLDAAFQGIPNVTGIADDIIIAGETMEEHDKALIAMLEASRRNNIGLNSDKFQFRQPKVKFYGHTLSDKGIQPCEDKLQAIKDLKAPESVKELMTILGMVTYLNRFSTKLAALTAPLRELTKKEVHFRWEDRHQAALNDIKTEMGKTTSLWYYDPDPNTKTILQVDASMLGLGAWLRQIDSEGNDRIVAMASRSLTDTEKRYSNIERECLAVQYGLEKFEYYLMGRQTVVESDHSPLEQIFKKNIADAPARLQRILLRCMRFQVQIVYIPGPKIPVADALSRVCIQAGTRPPQQQQEVSFVAGIECPIDLQKIKQVCQEDPTHNMLRNAVYRGWPESRKQCPAELWDYWNFRCDLVIDDGIVLKGNRIVVPEKLRKEVLKAIHTGHQGESKCILLARESVFWPGVTKDIRQMVQECATCSKYQPAQPRLPILQPELPTSPWKKLGIDIFEYKSSKYLIVADYYSRYIIVRKLANMRAETICEHLQSILLEFGIPETIIADQGTQFMSESFKKKCRDSNIEIRYSAPYHHQANSVAERAVGTVKHLWNKALDDGQDKATALWMYRVTPLDDTLPSPYELLFGQKPKLFLPNSGKKDGQPSSEQHQAANQRRQENQAKYYRHGNDMRQLWDNETVDIYNTITKLWEPGFIVGQRNPVEEPRTYVVNKNGKEYYRTREHIRPRKAPVPPSVPDYDIKGTTKTPTQEAIEIHSPTKPDKTAKQSQTTQVSSPAKTPVLDKQPRVNSRNAPLLRPHTTRSGRTTTVPVRYTT